MAHMTFTLTLPYFQRNLQPVFLCRASTYYILLFVSLVILQTNRHRTQLLQTFYFENPFHSSPFQVKRFKKPCVRKCIFCQSTESAPPFLLGGKHSVPNFEKGGIRKKCLLRRGGGGGGGSCQKRFFKIKYGFESSIFKR